MKIGDIKVGYTLVSVWLIDGLGGGNYRGLWHPSENKIEIDGNLSRRDRIGVFWHERVHAISDNYGLGISEIVTNIFESEIMTTRRAKTETGFLGLIDHVCSDYKLRLSKAGRIALARNLAIPCDDILANL